MAPSIPQFGQHTPILLTARRFSWRTLVKTGLRGAAYIYVFGAFWATKSYFDMKTAASIYDTQVFEASVESGDWRCYRATQQYHEECAVLDP